MINIKTIIFLFFLFLISHFYLIIKAHIERQKRIIEEKQKRQGQISEEEKKRLKTFLKEVNQMDIKKPEVEEDLVKYNKLIKEMNKKGKELSEELYKVEEKVTARNLLKIKKYKSIEEKYVKEDIAWKNFNFLVEKRKKQLDENLKIFQKWEIFLNKNNFPQWAKENCKSSITATLEEKKKIIKIQRIRKGVWDIVYKSRFWGGLGIVLEADIKEMRELEDQLKK